MAFPLAHSTPVTGIETNVIFGAVSHVYARRYLRHRSKEDFPFTMRCCADDITTLEWWQSICDPYGESRDGII